MVDSNTQPLSPDDQAAMEQDVNYQNPTQSANEATSTPEGQPLQASGLGGFSPAGAVLDAAGNVVNFGDKLANYNKNQQQSTVTAPDFIQKPVEQLTQETHGQNLDQAAGALQTGANTQAQLTGNAVGQAENQFQNYINKNQQISDNLNAYNGVVNAATDLGKQYDDFVNLPQDQKIDPTRYVKNLGVSGQTVAALGMVLSGFGSGLSGQPNLAVNSFQKNVERDISAQTTANNLKLAGMAQERGIIMDKANAIQMQTVSKLVAQRQVLTGIESSVNYALTNAKTQADKDRAGALLQNLRMEQYKVDTNFYQVVKGNLQTGNSRQNGLYGEVLSSKDLLPNGGVPTYGSPGVPPAASPEPPAGFRVPSLGGGYESNSDDSYSPVSGGYGD